MRDANAKVGRETVHQPTTGKHSLYKCKWPQTGRICRRSNLPYFMHKRIHHQTWHSPDGHTFNQIDHCSTEDTFLTLLCRASNTKPQQLRRFAVDRRKDRDVASRYYDEVESELQGVQVQPLSLDEKC
jgi:hypothetical protein